MSDKNLNWKEKALCKDLPLENYFIDKITLKNRHIVIRTYQICDACLVADHCLRDALRYDDEGTRAGTNYFHRQHILQTYFDNNKKLVTLDKVSKILHSIKRMPISLRMSISRKNFNRIGKDYDIL